MCVYYKPKQLILNFNSISFCPYIYMYVIQHICVTDYTYIM